MYLLDTDVLSALAKRRRDPHVERWLARRRDDELFLRARQTISESVLA
jgi:predicted nucleic acid-binding protein